MVFLFFFFQAEDGIRDRSPSRGLGDVYKRQGSSRPRGAEIANALTMLRLLVVPAFIYFLATSGGEPSLPAAVLFGWASVTDWVDGQIARRTGTVTEFGRLADPLADRMLIGSALLILLVQDRLPPSGLMTVLFRDAFLLAGNYILLRGGVRIQVVLLGKAATMVLMLSLIYTSDAADDLLCVDLGGRRIIKKKKKKILKNQ